MKKLLSLILALIIVASLCACGGKTNPTQQSGSQAPDPQSTAAPAFTFKKPVTIIVPYDPSSATATYAQKFASIAEQFLGVSTVIEYKPGGSTGVGMNYMCTKPADGYTIMLTGRNTECALACDQIEGLTENDYAGLCLICADPGVIAVRADSNYNSMQDLIDDAKKNPGTQKWGGTGTLGVMHFFALQTMKAAGIEVEYIPYTSAGEVSLALLGNNIDVALGVPTTCMPYVESGDFRILAHGLPERSPLLDGIPSLFETPDLAYEKYQSPYITSRVFTIKSGTPAEVLAAWDDVFKKTVETPEWKEFLGVQSADGSCFLTSADTEKAIKTEIASYREIYKSLK